MNSSRKELMSVEAHYEDREVQTLAAYASYSELIRLPCESGYMGEAAKLAIRLRKERDSN